MSERIYEGPGAFRNLASLLTMLNHGAEQLAEMQVLMDAARPSMASIREWTQMFERERLARIRSRYARRRSVRAATQRAVNSAAKKRLYDKQNSAMATRLAGRRGRS